jgi:hypothetical protein
MPMSLLDIARRELSAGSMFEVVSDVVRAIPELSGQYHFLGEVRTIPNAAQSTTIKGRTYYFPIVKSLPTVSFRDANEGVTMNDYVIENKLVETFIMNPNWWVDVAVADQDKLGAGALLAEAAALNIQASMYHLARQFYYGTANDPKGFPGLVNAVGYGVNATGTTNNTCSSVYAVKWGPQGARWIFGENGNMRVTPVAQRPITVSNVSPTTGQPVVSTFTGYFQELFAYPGLHVGSPRSIGRIRNLTADAGKGLTDALLGALLEACDQRFWPDMFLMTNRSAWQLQRSRTATSSTGAPAPLPTEYAGIPIVITDSLTNTEAIS